ncbi:10788_t:CDS:10, partial [Scutellospora calospora]
QSSRCNRRVLANFLCKCLGGDFADFSRPPIPSCVVRISTLLSFFYIIVCGGGSIVDNENPNHKFDLSNIPITIPHSIYFVTVTRQLKNVGDFIHFGAETIQYNSVTGNSDIKIDMTSEKMIIEATDIDYLRTSSINIGESESSHSTISDTLLIIDIIDDDIDSTITKAPQDQYGSFRKSVDPVNANIEAIPSYNNKEYHTIDANIKAGPSNNNKKYNTTIKDYLSDEKQFDHKNSQPTRKEIAKEALAEFQDIVDLNELYELPSPLELTDPLFEINFDYNHSYITTSHLNILLDVLEWANFYRLPNNTIETDVESDDRSDTEKQVDHNLTCGSFIISSYNSKLTAINLHVDYQFQNRCVPGYDAIDGLDFSDDNDNLAMNNAPNNTIHRLDPEVVIRSGLKNNKTVDFAMNFLRIRGRFSIKKFSSLDNDNINFTENFESEAIRSSDDINSILKKDINLIHSLINLWHNNHENAHLNITITENSDTLETFILDLNNEQKMAYYLFCKHHQKNNQLSKNKPSQLLFYLTSASGTSKFRVIHAICSYFEYTSQSNILIVLAPTSIAAINICESTIHSACRFSFDESLNTRSNLSKEKYAIIDETSMIGQNLLSRFHTFTKKIKASDDSTPFAGINILFAGNFMQLLPVLDKALYMSEKITYFSPPVENETSKNDPFYASILKNMHHSNITEIQLELNLEAVKEHAYDNNQFIIYSCVMDSYNRKILTRNNHIKFLSVSNIKENILCRILSLSINMKVVLTVNICTNDNMANGLLEIFQQIVYDQNSIDYSSSRKNNIVLKGPPKYVIVELTDKESGTYKTLPSNYVPIYSIKCACVYTIWRHNRSMIHRNFQHFQLPLASAYTFTDFKSQGYTLQKTIVNLSGRHANNSAYIMLSRTQS